MASSKDVLTVLGTLCVNKTFRNEFFANPQSKAQYLVGKLKGDELEQINALGGNGVLPSGLTRSAYLERLTKALDEVYAAMTCPMPPCPDDPDPPAPQL